MKPDDVTDTQRRLRAAGLDQLHRELADHEFTCSLITAEIRARQAKQREYPEGD